MSAPFVKGQKVYAVVANLMAGHPDVAEQNEYVVQERTVKDVGPKTLRLDRPFSGSTVTMGLVKHTEAHRLFSPTPAEAIDVFHNKVGREIVAIEQRLARNREALSWAEAERRKHLPGAPGSRLH